MQVDSSIFKAYDIRGVVDKTLTEDVARAVGRVLGSLAVEANVSAFCVGRDGRLSGERLMNALVEGIASTGMKVLDVGAVPTPVLTMQRSISIAVLVWLLRVRTILPSGTASR